MGVTTNNPSNWQVVYEAETKADIEAAIEQARARRATLQPTHDPRVAVISEVLVGLKDVNTQVALGDDTTDSDIIATLTRRGSVAENLDTRNGECSAAGGVARVA